MKQTGFDLHRKPEVAGIINSKSCFYETAAERKTESETHIKLQINFRELN
jgi:hypothetical protein